MIRKLLWGLAGVVWGGACFAVGVQLGFPEDAARARIAYEVAEASDDEYAVDFGGLAPWRLSGLDARDVKLYTVKKPRKGLRGKKGKAKAEEHADTPEALERTLALGLDRLAVRAAILPLLTGNRAVAFVAESIGGTLDGTWSQSDKGISLAFDADDLDLSKLPRSEEGTNQLAFLGKLQGHADLVLDSGDPKKSTGTLRLDLPGFGLEKGSKVGGFELPEVIFDKAVVAFEAKDGKLEVTEGTFESSTLTATVSGNIALNKRLARSRLRLEIVFTLPEDLDKLAQLAPDLKRARDSEGQYHYLVTGTILDPSARPNRAGKRAAKGLRDKGDGEGPGLLDGPGLPGANGPLGGANGDMNDEERRAAREERLRERRERMRKRREDAEKSGSFRVPNDDFEDEGPPPFDDGPPPPPEGPPFDDGPPRGPPLPEPPEGGPNDE
jgi:type II secretion system protein N